MSIVANADVSTSTYSYDSNGNLTSGAGWGYTWDYLNRMLSSGFGGSTTTYAYDGAGNRVLQTSTTSTTFYPSKFYSFASMLVGSTTYATSTNYIWNGDTLLATIDQPMVNGSATSTAVTRYIHPDHLGSTNAVTDQNGNLVQLLDYFPFGATRVSTSTYPTSEKRDYIGQFTDPQTSLDYLNARYYDSGRGQFLSEDPVFLGEPKQQNLSDPQSLNVYGYASDNPIAKKDPSGRQLEELVPIFEKASSEVEPIIGNVETSVAAESESSAAVQNSSPNFFELPTPEKFQQSIGWPTGEPSETAPINWRTNTPLLFSGSLSAALLWLIGDQSDNYQSFTNEIQPYKNISNQKISTLYVPSPKIVGQLPYTNSQNHNANQPTNIRSTSSSNSGSSLPATVNANGTTYYRNSSGLLSTSPGH